MKLYFREFFEYDEVQDGTKILGYDSYGKIHPLEIGVYKKLQSSWVRATKDSWVASEPPIYFAKFPKSEKAGEVRKPSMNKINNLSFMDAVSYLKRSDKMKQQLTNFVKQELKREFYQTKIEL